MIEGEKDFVGRAPSAADGDGGVGTEDGSAASELLVPTGRPGAFTSRFSNFLNAAA